MELKQAIPTVAALLWMLGTSAPASAQDQGSGTFRVKFQEISNSCSEVGLDMAKGGTLTIARRGKELEVKLPQVPVMKGKVRKGGKFKVAAERDRTSIRGVDASFSAAGRADRAKARLVLIAEYYRDGKALCTQSWDVAGTRK